MNFIAMDMSLEMHYFIPNNVTLNGAKVVTSFNFSCSIVGKKKFFGDRLSGKNDDDAINAC